MDLIRLPDTILVAGPDTMAFIAPASGESLHGLRFRPGILPRLLGVPAADLRDTRTGLRDLVAVRHDLTLASVATELAWKSPRAETAPWPLAMLGAVTRGLGAGATVSETARDAGWSSRTLQRQCSAVYGYGPATLRRILRFRRAVGLLDAGASLSTVAARAGYADQPHLHREVRALTGTSLRQLAANRSTATPSGSSTVA